MSSLQEQLLKAGLTTKHKARQANADKRKKNKQKRSGAAVEQSLQDQVKQDLAIQQSDKKAKDAQLNQAQKQALVSKEQQQRILQILQHHHIKDISGEIEFNFTDENKIKKLYINEQTQKALIAGRLAICQAQQQYYLVTTETADKLATIDAQVVLLSNEKQVVKIDEDDPYADYQIPDDLMW